MNVRTSGFTLLEMVVVLVLVGLITSLALPGLNRMYDSMNAALIRDELRASLNALPLAVRQQGRALQMSHFPDDTATHLPEEIRQRWQQLEVQWQAEPALFISASGFCPEPSTLNISLSGRTYTAYTRSPDCRLEFAQ